MNLIKIRKILDIPTEEELFSMLLPTEEDIKESKNLSENLKDSSEEKTFVNIIKFQESVIPYWNERKLIEDVDSLPINILIFIASFFIGLVMDIVFVIFMVKIVKITSAIMVIMIFIVFPFIFISIRRTIIEVLIAVTIDRFRKMGFNFGSGIYNNIIYYIKYRKEIKMYISSVVLPIKKILEWKLAVCRDYVRLTTSLLYNLYTNSEIYIIRIANHVASGIKFNGKIYVFDPNFSVQTNAPSLLDEWLKKQLKKRKFEDAHCSEKRIKNFIILTYTKKDKIKIWDLRKYWRSEKTRTRANI
ncbi:hypothetical protein A2Z22_01920 [Candidatus Woesebacteria bacterium RBG_16_34_12]|uniref:Transglutaminase-like domain-containing protein n=1 Tax=Candidatus Woesebacteria bacterium RBG_16_34_12 TaxID=1802480 RepID=A0A1F7XAQ5_9BACT|nr:MAG: hypothetical protein A2Z22_01920 [Candidatus Woesebacteria bacterium RBG_16_34_12]